MGDVGWRRGRREKENVKRKEIRPPDRQSSNVWQIETRIRVHRKRGRGGSGIPGVAGGWEGTECFCGYDEACTRSFREESQRGKGAFSARSERTREGRGEIETPEVEKCVKAGISSGRQRHRKAEIDTER